MDYAILAASAAMLYLGAEWLVAGASRLALSLRIPQLVVGLTVVAYGTSTPEIVVGIGSAATGHGDVALGNVLGSNIANLGLILGIAALIRPARVDGELRRRELPVLLVATVALPAVLADGVVSRLEGAALVATALAYTAWAVRGARAHARAAAREVAIAAEAAEAAEGAPVPPGRARQLGVALLGLLAVLAGGELFVGAATSLARTWGMSERLVGLTIVAIGTSLPELATSVIAALRGHSDLAIGNVVGSNIFNALLCLGLAALTAPIEVDRDAIGIDLVVVVAMTAAAAVFLRTARTMRRWEAAILLGAYATFLGYLIAR